MDKNCKRIAYYTKKVAQFGSVHWTKRPAKWRNRSKRLKEYKKVMHASF